MDGDNSCVALEWVLRPYAGYIDELKRGFSLADEFYTRRTLDQLKGDYGFEPFHEIDTGFTREDESKASVGPERDLVAAYHAQLSDERLIDFDMVLHLTFQLLGRRPEISKTLAAMIRLVCIDEYQDTQDLQYGILSSIVRASQGSSRVFIVGDRDQAIYSSLGGVARTLEQIEREFGLSQLEHRELSGNYRSTQRIVDFSSQFQDADLRVESKADYADDSGSITFSNGDVHKDDLGRVLASLVAHHLDAGVKDHEICVIAPRWQLVMSLGRLLIQYLPNIDLDAPGLSPLRYQRDSMWFQLARLFLTDPDPRRYRSRLRWAGEFVRVFEQELGRELDDKVRQPRNVLRIRNAIHSDCVEGIPYLEDAFAKFMAAIEIDIEQYPTLIQSRDSFFDGARARLENVDYDLDVDVESLKKMFRHPAGVVVNTCHGVKGEEYTVVVCFGVLRGYIPHWQRIFDDETDEREDARRLLYVVSSRARKHLHLFAEDGRTTQSGNPYETTIELVEVRYDYDACPVEW